MNLVQVLLLCALQGIDIYKGEVLVSNQSTWRQDNIFAPGDTITIDASVARKGPSTWGCLAGLFAPMERDDISELSFSHWGGADIERYYGKSNVLVKYFTADGGPFSVVIRNSSSHRSKFINLYISRLPTNSKYLDFNTAFRADTTYDTTWVDEPVYRTRYDTSYVQIPLPKVISETTPVELRSEKVTLKGQLRLSGSNVGMYDFKLPENSTGELAYSLYADEQALEQDAQQVREQLGAAKTALSLFSSVSPAVPALGALLGVIMACQSSTGATYDYSITDAAGLPYRQGNQVVNAVGKVTLEPGKYYVLKLDNEAVTTKPTINFSLLTRVVKTSWTAETFTQQSVKSRKETVGTQKVPNVQMRVKPILPWGRQKQEQ